MTLHGCRHGPSGLERRHPGENFLAGTSLTATPGKATFPPGPNQERRHAPLHPRLITAPDGKRLSVLLPLAEYEALMERLEDLEDLEEAREVLARIARGEEEIIPWESVKAELGL